MNKKFTPDNISSLSKNEIFVFGSNIKGNHQGGAARIARELFGAIVGHGVGLQGQSYAIPTMQGGVETIKPYVDDFIQYAQKHPELTFYVTRIGCGIAGFKDEQIAPLFDGAFNLPNVILPEKFWYIINHAHQLASEIAGMVFHTVQIKFSDEDMLKMEGMTHEQKNQYIKSLKQQGKYSVVHESPEPEYPNTVLNCNENGHHKIAITENTWGIIAGSKLYSSKYEWGVDFGQKIMSVVANDGWTDKSYGQFFVLLEDGSINELWSESCINPVFEETGFCSIACGCDGLVFGLRPDGTVTINGAEKNPVVAHSVSRWTNIRQIDAGHHHVVGLRHDGTVVAAGKESACQALSQWRNISRIYVCKNSRQYSGNNDLTLGIQNPGGWLLVGGDIWSPEHEFFKRIRAQYEVSDVLGNSYELWVRTRDNIVRCINYATPMETYGKRCFINKNPDFRYMDTFAQTMVLVDKDGEFHIYRNDMEKEISWHH